MAEEKITELKTPPSEKKVPRKVTGIARVIKAFFYSWDGLVSTFKSEAAFRQELALAVIMIPLAVWLAPHRSGLALMVGSVLLVLAAELLNSALEAVVNRAGSEWNAYAKHAKDAGSAAVLLALIHAGAVWLILLWPNCPNVITPLDRYFCR
jgi:diacylglycerol kinase (ATP)